ncbi:hypothetical protein VYU27_008444 [Nannochloropsis oceanica]
MAESKQQRRKRRPSTVRTYTPIHTLPLLATAAGLALVTTTTLFSFPTSTAVVVVSATASPPQGHRTRMGWVRIFHSAYNRHMPSLPPYAPCPSLSAPATTAAAAGYDELRRNRRTREGIQASYMTPARGNRGMEGGGGGEGGGGVEGGLKNTSPLTGKNSSSSSSSISSLGRRSMIGDDIRKGLGLDAPSPPSSSSSSSLEARLGGSGATAATPVKTSGSSTIISNSDSSSSSSSSGSSNTNKPLPPSISQSAPSPTPTATAAQQQRRQRAKDQKIFKKIVDSQTTAAVRLMGRREGGEDDLIWNDMRRDAEMECRKEPLLVSSMYASILNHRSLEQAVSFHMATKLATPSLIGTQIEGLFRQCFEEEPSFSEAIRQDMIAVMDRDPACRSYLDALLYFKGFQALQAHRVAHWLWKTGRDTLAFFLQSQINQLFQIDIHPAARIGSGVFIDHGTGIVIGETAVVGHNVSMLHMVTLGGSGKKHVDRHPKIGDGVLLGAGATILGNVQVGKGSLVGACSLVLEDIGPNSVAVGVPAKVVGQTTDLAPAQSMRQADAIAMVEGDLPDFII